MARRSGALDPLDIAAVFVVVFALMYGGVQFTRGELLPEDRNDARETQLRYAVWDALNDNRTEQGYAVLDPNDTDTDKAHGVQDVAERLAADGYFGNVSEGHPTDEPAAQSAVTTGTVLCEQAPAMTTVTDPAWNDTASDERVDGDLADSVGARLATLLLKGYGPDVAYRGPSFSNRIGLEVDGQQVYVVYRSCTVLND